MGYGENDFVDVLSHPIFSPYNLEDLENKRIKPPFMPNFGKGKEEDLKDFFNVDKSKQGMAETYIPMASKKEVKKLDDAFEKNFTVNNFKK